MNGAGASRFSPVSSRLTLSVPPAAGAALLALAGGLLGGAVGAVLMVVAGIGLAVLLAGCWRIALLIDGDALVVQNPFRTRRITAAEIAEFRPERLAGLVGPKGAVAGVALRNTRTVRILATVGTRGHEAATLYLALRRWSAEHGFADGLARREYGHPATRRALLADGGEVEVPCRLRRTDARGWGPWTAGWLHLPPAPEPSTASATRASWRPEGGGSALPVRVAGTEEVVMRDVRFPEEAFFGADTGFIGITTLRRVTELALEGTEADLAFRRLHLLDNLGADPDPDADPAPGPAPSTAPGDSP